MFEFLKYITPKIKFLSLSLILIFLPGAIISYLSLKSIQDKAENQRIKYHGTVDLVRNKLEGEVYLLETNLRNSVIDSLLNLNADSDKQSMLRRLEIVNPAFKNLFLITLEGGIINSFVTLGFRESNAIQTYSGSFSSHSFSKAEESEFIGGNFPDAIKHYEEALGQVKSPRDHTLILSRIGRNYYKQGKFTEGIREYRKILDFEAEKVTIGQVPASIVAYYQISKGYQALALNDDYHKSILELYHHLLNNPWDLEGGEYLFYLQSVSRELLDIESTLQINHIVAAELDSLRAKEIQLLELIEFMDIIKNLLDEISSDLNSTISSEIKHQLFQMNPGSAIELGYFKIPSAQKYSDLIALGFQFEEEYILTNLFPRVLSTVELGKDIAVGILNEKDSLLLIQEKQLESESLVAENFKQSFFTWKVALFDRSGKSIEQLAGREKRLYLALFLGVLAVMLIGIIVLARAVIHETEVSRMKSEFVSNV